MISNVLITTDDDNKNPVIGYEYNLWGIKADRIAGKEKLLYTGRIFLDVRKEFKSTHDEDEHWFFSKEVIEDGQVLRIQGSDKPSLEVKHHQTEDYYVTLKLGNKWSRFYYQDILNEEKSEVGKDVGCEECNFSEQIYLPEEDWIITLYFEIKPYYKFPKIDAEDEDAPIITDSLTNDMISSANIPDSIKSNNELGEQKDQSEEEIYVVSTHKMPEINKEEGSRAPMKVSFSPTRYYPKSTEVDDKFTDAPIPLVPSSTDISYHVLFRIMPTAYEEFEDVQEIGILYRETYQENGKTRYLVGHSRTLEEARNVADKMQGIGYRNLYIASYREGNLQKYAERIK